MVSYNKRKQIIAEMNDEIRKQYSFWSSIFFIMGSLVYIPLSSPVYDGLGFISLIYIFLMLTPPFQKCIRMYAFTKLHNEKELGGLAYYEMLVMDKLPNI